MITIVASYVSGQRDNHACGVWVAVCNLFNDEARRRGHVVEYDFTPRAANNTSLITYTVRAPTAKAALELLNGCNERRLPTRTHLAITADTDHEAAPLQSAGYYPARLLPRPESLTCAPSE